MQNIANFFSAKFFRQDRSPVSSDIHTAERCLASTLLKNETASSVSVRKNALLTRLVAEAPYFGLGTMRLKATVPGLRKLRTTIAYDRIVFDLPAGKVLFWHEDSVVGTIEIQKYLNKQTDMITLTDLEGVVVVELEQ